VAGPVLVLAGVTAAALAVFGVAPVAGLAAGGLAAASQWGPIAEAIELAAKVPLLGDVAKEIAKSALVAGAKRLVGKVLRRGRKPPEDADDDEDPVERAAQQALAQLDHAEIGRLLSDWRLVRMQVEPEPGHIRWGTVDVTGVARAQEAIDATRAVGQTQMQALFLLWDAVLGAGWATPEVRRLLEAYFRSLTAVETAIETAPSVDVEAAEGALRELGDVAGELRRPLDEALGKG
jgi:hypothetical protein